MDKASILDFIRWALTHVDPNVLPEPIDGTEYPLAAPFECCGIEPWHYFHGADGEYTTKNYLERMWRERYNRELPRDAYDSAVAHMRPYDRAVNSIGLLRAYQLDRRSYPTRDAQKAFELCSHVAEIAVCDRPYVLGEVVFCESKEVGQKTMIGFVCGKPGRDPYIVEAWNFFRGVTLSRIGQRPWTHRGLLTGIFEYPEENNVYRKSSF